MRLHQSISPFIFLAYAALAFCFPTFYYATAQDSSIKPSRNKSKEERAIQYASAVFVLSDKNKSGRLEQHEINNLRWSPNHADKNDDGNVSFEEFANILGVEKLDPTQLPQSRNEMLISLAKMVVILNDTDGNYQLEKKEWAIEGQEFGRILHPNGVELLLRAKNADRDKDGAITVRELILLFGGSLPRSTNGEKKTPSTSRKLEKSAKNKQALAELANNIFGNSEPHFFELNSEFDENLSLTRIILFLFDENGNTQIDQDEREALISPDGEKLVLRNRADKNRDGVFTFDELMFNFGVDSYTALTRPLSKRDKKIIQAIERFVDSDINRNNKIEGPEFKGIYVVETDDMNRDGQITLKEYVSAQQIKLPKVFDNHLPPFINFQRHHLAHAILSNFDANRDDSLSQTERERAVEFYSNRFLNRPLSKLIASSDKDQDGKSSADELVQSLGGTPIKSLKESYKKFAEQLMEIYDSNHNQVLDNSEISDINWLVFDVDGKTNGIFDDKISLDELIIKFGPLRGWTAPRKPNNKSPRDQKRVVFMQELVYRFDQNNDGLLLQNEIDIIRPVPEGADKNKDGKISPGELIDAYFGDKQPK